MRLSVVFELLLILLIIAFAASRVIENKKGNHVSFLKRGRKHMFKQSEPNKYCTCSSAMCNCCREFNLPVVQVKGPGCATISYVKDNEFGISMKFGDRVLRNITLSGNKPRPVCMGLPGGVSKFCGRVYGLEKQGDQFKACLGLELRALDDVEAALRVSCFRFGPGGLKLEPAEPFPTSNKKKGDEEDEDEDDDDYGLDDDDDDDDDDDLGLDDDDDDDDHDSGEDAADNDVDSADYTGFSALSDEFLEGFFGSDSSNKKKKKPVKEKPVSPAARPVKLNPKPVRRPVAVPTVPTKNRYRVTTPKITTRPTTVRYVPPSSPSKLIETPAETEQPTTEDDRDEVEELATSTMMSITSMQLLEDKDPGAGAGAGETTTTDPTTTTEEQTESFTEEISPTNRVEDIKYIDSSEESGNKKREDEDEEEEDGEEGDDDDDDDVDVTSVVSSGLLDDDDEEEQTNANTKDKLPNKNEEVGVLQGILDEIDDDDDDEEDEDGIKHKSKKKHKNISTTFKPKAQPTTTSTTTQVTEQAVETTTQGIITPPPVGGMRLYFSDPKHPPKGRSPLSARSGREHRRMRLPPLGTEVVVT